MKEIVHWYEAGTDFNIHMDEDGLIVAGSGYDQVTWMDVRVENILPTPRHGKPVEINAYWYNALLIMDFFTKALGKEELVSEYLNRSLNYGKLFDRETGFMRGRDKNGVMAEDFDPTKWGKEYTEAAAWQTTFSVQHDLDGLAELMGGREAILKKLDELFATPPYYSIEGYGREIHEMTEMAALDFGQCAINNQPSFHLPYIYAYFGEEEKARYWVHKMANEAFSYKEDGFPGDDDNGTTSAWYIFACLGFYPICPGSPKMVEIQGIAKDWSIPMAGLRKSM